MDDRKVYRVILSIECAGVSSLIEIATLMWNFFDVSHSTDDISTFSSHSLLEHLLDVVLGSGSDAVVMLHHSQQFVSLS